jgi:hypothetical protein
MVRKQSRILNPVPPIKADDFRLIKGIGPVLAGRLYDAGVCTYNQLAFLSPAKLAEMVTGLSVKQISKQDWSGQALKLAKKTQPKPPQKDSPKRSISQHYENFTIEFLLDEKNIIHRTRVVHVQSGDADTWAGWEVDQLIGFLARHASVRIQAVKLEKKEKAETLEQRPGNIPNESISIITGTPDEPLSLMSGVLGVSKPSPEIAYPISQSMANTNFTGTLRLKDLKVFPIGSDTPIHSLHQDQPYRVRLTLDLTNVVIPSNSQLRYKATINFKQLGGTSYSVAEESNTITLPDCMTLDIVCSSRPPGLYRPDAFVKLFSDQTPLGLMASLKGESIQIF